MTPLSSTHKALLAVFALFFVNCAPIVGGTCKYEKHQGTATVIGLKDGYVLAEFKSDQAFTKARLYNKPSKYHLYGIQQAHIGDKFSARLSAIYQGSCTPIRLSVVHQP